MEKYHNRRPEKVINDQTEMLAIIREQKFLTFALAKDNEPYIVTVNYAYDEAANCFYFHAAKAGKKIDYLNANPTVWGQILEDQGYLQGECNHAYRTVQFKGQAELITNLEEQRHALHMMIDRLEATPEPMKKQFIEESAFKNVAIYRIKVEGFSGKKYVEKE